MIADEVVIYNKAIQRKSYEVNSHHIVWIKSIEFVENCFVVPQTVRDRTNTIYDNTSSKDIYNGGVYRNNGEIVEAAIHKEHHDIRNIPESSPDLANLEYETLEGTWIFGGFLKPHIGHMVTESLGRLWALDEVNDPISGVIFIHMNGIPSFIQKEYFESDIIIKSARDVIERNPFVSDVTRFFCGDIAIKIVGKPLRVENLIVPSELMGLHEGDLIGGHRTYRNFIRSRACAKPTLGGTGREKKVYVSRAKMPVSAGRFFMEEYLEDLLFTQGYEIIRPEYLPFSEQMKIYSESSHIILGSGSACHVLALACHERHQIALLHRSPGTWEGFGRQLRLMGAGKVVELAFINGSFVPDASSGSAKPSIHSANLIHSIDFSSTWCALSQSGFVAPEDVTCSGELLEKEKSTIIQSLEAEYRGSRFVYMKI